MPRKEIKEERSNTRLVTFQPGNYTRYEILFTPVPTMPSVFGMCWLNPISGPEGRFHIFQSTDSHGLLHYGYFMDKMDCSAADAAALLVLINEEYHRTVVLPPGFNAEGLYIGGHESVEVRGGEPLPPKRGFEAGSFMTISSKRR